MLVKLNKKVNQHVTVEKNLANDMTYFFQNRINYSQMTDYDVNLD